MEMIMHKRTYLHFITFRTYVRWHFNETADHICSLWNVILLYVYSYFRNIHKLTIIVLVTHVDRNEFLFENNNFIAVWYVGFWLLDISRCSCFSTMIKVVG